MTTKTRALTMFAALSMLLLGIASKADAGQGQKSARAAKKPAARVITRNAKLGNGERLEAAGKLLRGRISPAKRAAILEAHEVGNGEVGKDGVRPAAINADGTSNFTSAQIARKVRILRRAGFKRGQIRKLLDHGITGGDVESLLAQITMLTMGNRGDSFAHMFIEDVARAGYSRDAQTTSYMIRGQHRKFASPKNDGSIIVMFGDNSGAYIHPDGFATPMGTDISREVDQWDEIK